MLKNVEVTWSIKVLISEGKYDNITYGKNGRVKIYLVKKEET